MTYMDDETVRRFLQLLDNDMRDHPDRLRPMSRDFMQRMELLMDNMGVDLDAPLPSDDGQG